MTRSLVFLIWHGKIGDPGHLFLWGPSVFCLPALVETNLPANQTNEPNSCWGCHYLKKLRMDEIHFEPPKKPPNNRFPWFPIGAKWISQPTHGDTNPSPPPPSRLSQDAAPPVRGFAWPGALKAPRRRPRGQGQRLGVAQNGTQRPRPLGLYGGY